MEASESGAATECKVCGRIFQTIEDLAMHNREAHSDGLTTGASLRLIKNDEGH
jgi:hypothetical protein